MTQFDANTIYEVKQFIRDWNHAKRIETLEYICRYAGMETEFNSAFEIYKTTGCGSQFDDLAETAANRMGLTTRNEVDIKAFTEYEMIVNDENT